MTTNRSSINPAGKYYENKEFQDVTGGAMRPGGQALTMREAMLGGLKTGMHVLDAGCGTGVSAELLENEFGVKSFGIDISQEMINVGLTRNSKLSISCGNAENIPFQDMMFDAVLSECCMSHFDNKSKVLSEFSRVLKQDGILILSDIFIREKRKTDISGGMTDKTSAVSSFAQNEERNCDTKILDREKILQLVKLSGFDMLLWEEHNEELTSLLIDIIMKFGSVESFFMQGCDTCGLGDVYKRYKLGYYILLAKKSNI